MLNLTSLIITILCVLKIWDLGLTHYVSGEELIKSLIYQLVYAALSISFGFWHIDNRVDKR